MASYEIRWKRSAIKELKRLPSHVVKRILVSVEALAQEPRPQGTRKLVGSENSYRIRVGEYRVVYTVLDNALVIEIVRVGHRSDVYG